MERTDAESERERRSTGRRRDSNRSESERSGVEGDPVGALHRSAGNQAVKHSSEAVTQRTGTDTTSEREEGNGSAGEPGTLATAEEGEIAQYGTAGTGSRLPHYDTIQRSFGSYDVSNAEAYTGRNAARASRALGARAFTFGSDVGFRSSSPSLYTAAHEAAHVVQQRASVPRDAANGPDSAHERHADAVADRVVAGQSAEAILDAAPGSSGRTALLRSGSSVVQRQTMVTTSSASTSRSGSASETLYETKNGSITASTTTRDDFTVEVAPIEQDGTSKVKITVTVHTGTEAATEGSGSAQSGAQSSSSGSSGGGSESLSPTGYEGSGSASAGVSGSATFTQVRIFPEPQAREYLDDLQRAAQGNPPSGSVYPEFEALGARSDGESGSLADVVGEESAAKRLKPGESNTLTLSGGANASASAEGSRSKSGSADTNLGASGSYERNWERTVTVEGVERNGAELVDVTVAFSESSSASGTVSGGVGRASGSYSRSSSEGSGRSKTFRLAKGLDDFDETYREIVSAATPSELNSLWEQEEYREHHLRETTSESRSSSESGSASVGGAQFDVGESQSYEEETTVGQQSVTGEATGEASKSAGVSAGYAEYSTEKTTSGTGTATEEGLETRVETETTTTSTGPGSGPTADQTLKALQGEPKAFVESLIKQQQTHLHGFDVGVEGMKRVIGRATNGDRWRACASRLSVLDPWIRLRRQLVSPQPDPELVEKAPDPAEHESLSAEQLRRQLNNVARAKAIASFFEATGEHGKTTWENMLQHWGGHDGYSSDLGLEYEWPPDLSEKQETFQSLREEVPAYIETVKQAQSGETSDETFVKLGERHAELDRQVQELRDAVADADGFKSARAKADLLAALNQLQVEMREARYSLAADRSGDRKYDRMALNKEIRDRTQLVESYRETEQSRIETAIQQGEQQPLLIDDLHEKWAAEMEKLAAAYERKGLEEAAITEELRSLTPDIERYAYAWQRVSVGPDLADPTESVRRRFSRWIDSNEVQRAIEQAKKRAEEDKGWF